MSEPEESPAVEGLKSVRSAEKALRDENIDEDIEGAQRLADKLESEKPPDHRESN